MKKLLILLTAAFPFFAVAQKTTALHIDPESAMGGKALQIFDSITYIPLENTKESTFGSMEHLQVSKNYFIFFDNGTKAILVFNKNGKLHGKITAANIPGMARNNSFLLADFVVNQFSENIYLYYNNANSNKVNDVHRVAVFKPDGGLLKIIPLDTSIIKAFQFSNFAFIDSKTTVFARDFNVSRQDEYFAIIKDFKTVVKNIVPVKENDPFSNDAKNFDIISVSSKGSFWQRQYDYTLFYLTNNEDNVESFRFVFPAPISLDSTFYKNSVLTKDLKYSNEFNRKNPQIVTGIISPFKMKGFLNFTIMKGNSSNSKGNFLYDFKKGNLYSLGKISTDSLSYYLPLFYTSTKAAQGRYIYLEVPSFVMFQYKEETKDKHPNYPPELQNYFATQDRKSNPVIVQLKLKENF